MHGGYGPRIFGENANNQVRNAIDALREKPTSRRVVLQVLDRTDMYGPYHSDIPCTNTIQFLVRDNKLHSIVSMRSNDAWMGMMHDIFAFTMIQEMVARDLDIDIGTYTHFVGSLHLYDGDREQASKFVDEGLQATTIPMDEMPPGRPWEGAEQLVNVALCASTSTTLAQTTLPDDPYWADLGRILLAHQLRKLGKDTESSKMEAEINLQPINELLRRKKTRGSL